MENSLFAKINVHVIDFQYMNTEEKLKDSVLRFAATHGEGGESLHVGTVRPSTFSGTEYSQLHVQERAASIFDPSCKHDVSCLFEISITLSNLEPLRFLKFFPKLAVIIFIAYNGCSLHRQKGIVLLKSKDYPECSSHYQSVSIILCPANCSCSYHYVKR